MTFDKIVVLDFSWIEALNGGNSLFLDSLMLTFTSPVTWIPLYCGLLFLVVKNNETIMQIIWTVASLLLAVAVSDLIADYIVKPSVARLRPINEPALSGVLRIVNGYRDSDFSFFSAHASNTMTIAVFSALLIRNRIYSFSLLLWSLLNCFTRLYLAMHYPSDIVVGITAGTIIGSLFYLLYRIVYRSISHNPKFISSHYTKTGYALSDVYIAQLLIIIALIYSIIKSTIYVEIN